MITEKINQAKSLKELCDILNSIEEEKSNDSNIQKEYENLDYSLLPTFENKPFIIDEDSEIYSCDNDNYLYHFETGDWAISERV